MPRRGVQCRGDARLARRLRGEPGVRGDDRAAGGHRVREPVRAPPPPPRAPGALNGLLVALAENLAGLLRLSRKTSRA